jgi:hypothetical protein
MKTRTTLRAMILFACLLVAVTMLILSAESQGRQDESSWDCFVACIVGRCIPQTDACIAGCPIDDDDCWWNCFKDHGECVRGCNSKCNHDMAQ